MATPKLLALAATLGELTPEEWAVVLREAADRVRTAPHWRGGRSDLAYRLRKAAEVVAGIAERRRQREAA